jgi:hypothetical protein
VCPEPRNEPRVRSVLALLLLKEGANVTVFLDVSLERCECDGVNVSPDNRCVVDDDPGRADYSFDHSQWVGEEREVVVSSLRIGHNKSGGARPAASSAGPLHIVGGRGRHVP